MPVSELKRVHVAVAVIVDGSQVLLSKRHAEAHQGGKWEFPGGKVERDETVQIALIRELHEELGIQVEIAALEPLMVLEHDYVDKRVCLDVWWVGAFSGVPIGQEGQPVEWCHAQSLKQRSFPEANQAIVERVTAYLTA